MLILNGFFKYSIYIGHSVLNSLILSSWFFYKLRKKIWIINLFKTILFLKLVFKFLKYLTIYNLPFWFINLDVSKEFLFKKYALDCGEFACTKIWIRGFLSNFKSIQNSIGQYILKKDILKISKKKYLIDMWGLTRFAWPRGIFLSDISSNFVICKEAGTISLPVVALVDTNVKSYLFNYPIPSNDDSLNSINYILSLISKKLLLYKYNKVILWYNKYKVKSKKLFNSIYLFNFKLKKKINFFNLKFINDKLSNKVKRFFNFKILYKNNIKKFLFTNIFNKYQHFIKNCNILMDNILVNLSKIKKSINLTNHKVFLLNQKLKFLNKISIVKNYTKTFLQDFNLKLKQQPLYLYKKTIKLKYSKKKIKSQLNLKKKIYLFYYLISNYLRKGRVFHETFFFNKPSPFVYIRAFHKYNYFYYNNKNKYDNSRFKDKKDYWYGWSGYMYKRDERTQSKFLNRKFNLTLLKNWKYNQFLSLSDSAILFSLEKWVTYSRKASLMRASGRHLLNYWLYPFFSKFSVKDNMRWYDSKFFYKEDVSFKRRFNWNLVKYKTPLTTFHFYNNWFSFLFKYKYKYKYNNELNFINVNINKKPVDPRGKYISRLGFSFKTKRKC